MLLSVLICPRRVRLAAIFCPRLHHPSVGRPHVRSPLGQSGRTVGQPSFFGTNCWALHGREGELQYWSSVTELDMPEFGSERFVLPQRCPPEGGAERYAPPDRRPPENHAAVEKVVTLLAKQRPEPSADSASATEHLDGMIRRIAMDSMTEVGRVIRDLENVSDMLLNEGERISREVNGYASLNRAATATMKVITESLKQWKERPSHQNMEGQ